MTDLDIMMQWAAGDWRDDPDGGTCHSIALAYRAGMQAAEDSKPRNSWSVEDEMLEFYGVKCLECGCLMFTSHTHKGSK